MSLAAEECLLSVRAAAGLFVLEVRAAADLFVLEERAVAALMAAEATAASLEADDLIFAADAWLLFRSIFRLLVCPALLLQVAAAWEEMILT
ncbi:hypothetical protein ACLKA6_000567 [Drosophila palustris]